MILSKARGKTGNIYLNRHLGKNIISNMPSGYSNALKKHQPEQTLKHLQFKALSNFLSNSLNILNIGFKNYNNKDNAFNTAFHFNFKNTKTDTPPYIDYSKMILSKGSRLGINKDYFYANNHAFNYVFWWYYNLDNTDICYYDQFIGFIYNITNNKTYIIINEYDIRANGFSLNYFTYDILNLGDQIAVYSLFLAPDKLNVSNSTFWGIYTID